MNIATATTTVYPDLAALPDCFEPLLSRAGDVSVFFTLPWFRNFVQSILTSREHVRIYTVAAPTGNASPAAALFMQYSDGDAGLLRARTLTGISNYYTSLFGPVIEPGQSDPQAILNLLASGIARDETRFDVVDLRPLALDGTVFPGLLAAFKQAGFTAQSYFCFGNWYLQVRGRSYAEYFDSLPSQLKNTVKRKRKQFEAMPNARIVLHQDGSALDEALRAYEQIYAVSWKVPEPYPQFIPGLCRTCAEEGWLRLGIIYIDDQPAAAQIWIVHAGIAAIYKLAYDEKFAKLSLGSILTSHLMRHVIDVDKVHEIDYLTGDDSYKKDWMSDRRERWGIMAFNLRTPLGMLAAARHSGARVAKRAIGAARRLGQKTGS